MHQWIKFGWKLSKVTSFSRLNETIGSIRSYLDGNRGTHVKLEGDDLTGEITLGATYEPFPGHRFGVVYRHTSNFDFKGDATINGQLLSDEAYLEAIEEHGDEFDARMGAEAVREMLMTIDLQREHVGLIGATLERLAPDVIAAGKKMFMEKPLAMDLDECDRLIRAARAAGEGGEVLCYVS